VKVSTCPGLQFRRAIKISPVSALPFGLYDVDGDISLRDVVIPRNAMIESNQHVKPGLLGFGQQFAIKRSRPPERNDVGSFVPYIVSDQVEGKILVEQNSHLGDELKAGGFAYRGMLPFDHGLDLLSGDTGIVAAKVSEAHSVGHIVEKDRERHASFSKAQIPVHDLGVDF